MTKTQASERIFAVCIRNDGYRASLEVRKLYQLIPDHIAATHDYVRVVDESGEDYLYPKDYFMLVELPPSVKDALLPVA